MVAGKRGGGTVDDVGVDDQLQALVDFDDESRGLTSERVNPLESITADGIDKEG